VKPTMAPISSSTMAKCLVSWRGRSQLKREGESAREGVCGLEGGDAACTGSTGEPQFGSKVVPSRCRYQAVGRAGTMETTMSDARARIEQQITVLLRRAMRVHITGSHAAIDLDRSAYAILCRLDDEGPQRLGVLATAFGLGPSTITRQVQPLERAGLAERTTDARDRRVTVLSLTETGTQAVQATRQHRRERYRELLADWPETDLETFADLLERFNASVDKVSAAHSG